MKLNRHLAIGALAGVLVATGVAGFLYWKHGQATALPEGIVGTNGRVEATQVDIATKVAGRVIEIVPHEGDMIAAGSVVARLDQAETEAQLRQGKAEAERARKSLASAQALVKSRQAELTLAGQNFQRASELVDKGWTTREKMDQRKQELESADSGLSAANAQVQEAQAAVESADANVERLQTQLGDMTITSPVRGRVQYRLIEPGSVLPAGGRIVTVLDLTDVYTTIFVPARDAGRLTIGDEARVVVDAAPDYVFPAIVSFVAPESQFTPKTVETKSEREQLYFRVKLQGPPDVLKGMEEQIKAGLRGMGYVRVDRSVAWPSWLKPKLPPAAP